jgi:hypothetical protein
VFETVIVLMLSSRLPANQIFGALLGYRALYYWLPLIAAALLLGLQESLRKQERLGIFVRLFERWVSPMVPQVFAFAAFIGGAILLFSGTTPVVERRIVFLKKLVPLLFILLRSGRRAGISIAKHLCSASGLTPNGLRPSSLLSADRSGSGFIPIAT